jgi:methionyl-tRNA formyltransferase
MRLVFCGSGEIGLPVLRSLLDAPSHKVMAVVTQPDKPAGRELKSRASAIKTLALKRGVGVFQPDRIRTPEAVRVLRELSPDVVVVVAYGQILSREVLDIPRIGCLNLHASLLPRHRGASPIQAAMLAEEKETGITVMWMNEGLDTGDILLSETLEISQTETAGELHNRLAEIAVPALVKALAMIDQGNAPRIPQREDLSTHAPKMSKADGVLDWLQPAARLALRVRAMSPWPGAFTHLGGRVLKIHEAVAVEGHGKPGTFLQADAEGFVVAAGVGALALKSVQLEGRKRMDAAGFLRGFPVNRASSMDLSFSQKG